MLAQVFRHFACILQQKCFVIFCFETLFCLLNRNDVQSIKFTRGGNISQMMDKNGETLELRFKWQSTASEHSCKLCCCNGFFFKKSSERN